jgi:glutamine cyclotransferase
MMHQLVKPLALLTFIAIVGSCAEGTPKQKKETKPVSLNVIRISSPTNGSLFTKGEKIELTLKFLSDTAKYDSIVLFVDSQNLGKFQSTSKTIETTNLKLGTRQIRATAWHRNQRQTASVSIMVKSDKEPKRLGYQIVNTYPHDKEAYTQGLFYYNGFLVESTGQQGQSSLRKVELKTGKILKSSNLERKYFGEGCALINGKIYQLTWTSRKGFIYDAETFSQIGTFDYPTQGWGLTTLSNHLVMSDGSNVLYFLEPENFSEVKRIEVYDNKGPVLQLNELEYIDGRIWANVYQTDKIVVIDPETGSVENEIDLSGLLKAADKHPNIDVLNGIAWDKENSRIFLTGKNWPKLFEIKVN